MSFPIQSFSVFNMQQTSLSLFTWHWRPVSQTVFPENLLEDDKRPTIDVFICTVDPNKESTVAVMSTIYCRPWLWTILPGSFMYICQMVVVLLQL
jgi:hypothetical protein